MKQILPFLLICCLIPSCAGCKGRKDRAKRHEPQPVILRDKPAPRPAEVKQVPQPTLQNQRAETLSSFAPQNQRTETLSSFSPQNQRTETLPSFAPPPQRALQPAQMAPVDSIGEPVPYVKSEPGIQYIQEGELAK